MDKQELSEFVKSEAKRLNAIKQAGKPPKVSDYYLPLFKDDRPITWQKVFHLHQRRAALKGLSLQEFFASPPSEAPKKKKKKPKPAPPVPEPLKTIIEPEEEDEFPCPHCGKIYGASSTLKRHITMKHPEVES